MNLLPEEFVSSFDPRKGLTTLVLVAIATALVVGITDVALLLWKETQVRKAEEKKLETDLLVAQITNKSVREEQLQAVKFRESNIVLKSLLDRHLYWTKFLGELEKYTLSTVNYLGINLDSPEELSLSGDAPNLETVVAQLEVFEHADSFISTASINSVVRTKDDRFLFIADLILVPGMNLDPISETNANQNTNASNTNSS